MVNQLGFSIAFIQFFFL